MSLMKITEQYLLKTKRSEILQTELLDYVSKKSGCSRESVRGTVIGFSPNKIMGNPKIARIWSLERSNGYKPARLVRKTNKVQVKNFGITYETKEKQRAREFVFKNIFNIKEPKILTMAGHQGGCVKYALEKLIYPEIHNVEKYNDVLNNFKKLNLPVTSFLSSMSEHLKNIEQNYDVIYYDSLYGLCDYIAQDLKTINFRKLCREVNLTLLNIKRIRNHGKFADEVRSKYYRFKDPTLTWIKKNMNNYQFVEEYVYCRKSDCNTRPMRVIKMKLK